MADVIHFFWQTKKPSVNEGPFLLLVKIRFKQSLSVLLQEYLLMFLPQTAQNS